LAYGLLVQIIVVSFSGLELGKIQTLKQMVRQGRGGTREGDRDREGEERRKEGRGRRKEEGGGRRKEVGLTCEQKYKRHP
jgi:hypothetical protein